MTCPQCGGHVTRVSEGRKDQSVVSIHPRRDEEPHTIVVRAPFDACDACEWLHQLGMPWPAGNLHTR